MARLSLSTALGAGLVALFAASACSSSEEDEGEVSSDGSGGGLELNGSGGACAGARAVISGGGEGNCEIVPDDKGCTGSAYEGEAIPLDIYLMFDVSGSMISCVDPPRDGLACPDSGTANRINAVRDATRQFLEDPASAGISVGLGYFGYHPYGSTSCNAADYSTPEVEMGTLPGRVDAMIESLDNQNPTGETPTGAAIRGACEYSADWKADNPTHKVVQLFITDGKPEAPVTCSENGTGDCCPTLEDAVTAASDCLEEGIESYVLGIGLLENLDDIASAGGTEKAYLASAEEDSAQQVLDALNEIRRDAVIPCELSIPPAPSSQTLRYDQVNIFYADPACNGSVFGYVVESSNCGEREGWYYDDPDNPSTMKLCPTSCETVAIPGSELVVTVGCDTVVEIY